MSYTIKGRLNTLAELPKTGNCKGDSYLIGKDFYFWSGFYWKPTPISGPKGEKGEVGPIGDMGRPPRQIYLTYEGIRVTIDTYEDVDSLFLDPDNLLSSDLAIFEVTYTEDYKDFRERWVEKRAIQIATEQFETWRKDYEEDK